MWWTAWLIGEHLDLSGNYRTGLPITPVHPRIRTRIPQHSRKLLHRLFHKIPALVNDKLIDGWIKIFIQGEDLE